MRNELRILSMVLLLAAANTSTGAPCLICAASESEPPKLNTTRTPGRAVSNFLASSVNVGFSDAAAKTTMSPVRAFPLVFDPDDAQPANSAPAATTASTRRLTQEPRRRRSST